MRKAAILLTGRIKKMCGLLEIPHDAQYNFYMKKYLSHYTAAYFWRVPQLNTVLGPEISRTDTVDITFPKSERIIRKKGQNSHSCSFSLPDGAILLRQGQWVSSPELLFLELACSLTIHRLILFGLQLCSHPPGCPERAITNQQKLKALLDKTPGYHGHFKAARAIKYIEDGSASIMESLAYMILRLPHTLGGYGLDGAVFNYEIKLSNESGKHLDQKRCFVDLYYKSEKLAVEYESFSFHSKPSEKDKDALRSEILGRQGLKVMHLRTIQLYDPYACSNFAVNLASGLDRRVQIRTRKFEEMHAHLRTLLPAGNRDVQSNDWT